MDTVSKCVTSQRIAVILTCFNRRQKTVACIDAVLAQTALHDTVIDFFITDDGSTDGTAEALREKHDRIALFKGDGTLFWNGGMRLAWDAAMRMDYDFYLWLNDDTFLYPETLRRLLDTAGGMKGRYGNACIAIGSTHDVNGQISYGGELRRSWLRPLTVDQVAPLEVAQPCDTFNGNCVLVSRAAARVLGNLDPGFIHAMGDTDYGFRARRAGIPMWVIPGYAGTCVNDDNITGGFGDPSLPLALRMSKALAPKGLPLRPWQRLCQRHAGFFWPVYWCWPYLKIVLTSCYYAARTRISRARQ